MFLTFYLIKTILQNKLIFKFTKKATTVVGFYFKLIYILPYKSKTHENTEVKCILAQKYHKYLMGLKNIYFPLLNFNEYLSI